LAATFTLAIAIATCMTPLGSAALSANPLPTTLICETQATEVAPDARVSSGRFVVTLAAADGNTSTATPPDGATGRWTPSDIAGGHDASLAARHRENCKAGCPVHGGIDGKPLELWAPRRAALDTAPAGERLTVAVVELASGKFRASTFIDRQIAALEQGTCKTGE
jgi:hypothetical protein